MEEYCRHKGAPQLLFYLFLFTKKMYQWHAMRRAYPSSSMTNRVVSTPPHSFSTCFGATGLVSAPPHLFPMCFDVMGVVFDTTPPVSDMFRCDGVVSTSPRFRQLSTRMGGFNTTPHASDMFRRDAGGFNTISQHVSTRPG